MSSHIRAVIVDDEPLARECIRIAIEQVPDVDVVAECGDGESAVQVILELHPDLVFLDVQMPGMDGFDVIDAIGADAMPAVVFVTGWDEQAIRAFDVHALDYVLKPFDDARFHEALRHARTRPAPGHGPAFAERLSSLLAEHGGSRPPGVRRLMVRARDRIRFIAVTDVDYFEAEGNYVRIHQGRISHLIRSSLSALEEQLDGSRFIRIHRSTIVNVDRVREVQPWLGGDYIAVLGDRRTLKVSRSYRNALLRPRL